MAYMKSFTTETRRSDRKMESMFYPHTVNDEAASKFYITLPSDLTGQDILALESRTSSEMESKESRIDDLLRINEELTRQLVSMSLNFFCH
jgi:hypothetical protein